MDIDKAFELLGKWGRYQTVIYILIFVASIPNSFTTMQFVISQYEPEHRCRLSDEIEEKMRNNSENHEEILRYFIPFKHDIHGNIRPSSCNMYMRDQLDEVFAMNSTEHIEIISCTNGTKFDMPTNHDTALTEYKMVCDDDWRAPLAITFYQLGTATGSMAGLLADRFGRRPVFLWASFAQLLSMALAAVSWDYYSYLVAVYLSGCTGLINYIVGFVLATEVISVDWRNFMAVGSMYSYSVGYCLIPLVAYLGTGWRSYLWAATCIGTVCYLPFYWLFPESPRWLLTMGRVDEAIEGLNKMAEKNKMKLNFSKLKQENLSSSNDVETRSSGPIETLRTIFRSRLTSRCLASFFAWFVTCVVYFGISYHSRSFSTDRYLNVLYAGLAEIPACVGAFYAANVLGRPRSLTFFFVTCGIFTIILPYIPQDMPAITTVISVLGKAAVTSVFYVIYLSTSELVPTLQRSAAMSIASFCGRVGAFIAPFIMFLDKIDHSVPNWIMGGITILCGILTIIYVPETRGVEMPNTTEKAENNKRFYGINICRKFASAKPNIQQVEGKELMKESTA